MEMSSFSMRLEMPWEKGVSTTQGTCGAIRFTSRATAKASLSALPGIQMTRSTWDVCSTCSASSVVDTWLNVGG